jgi:hypothetical protein
MNVTDLNHDELAQLKQELYYMVEVLPNMNEERLKAIQSAEYPDDITDKIVYEMYDGISFVEEDFWCNVE